MGKLDPSQQDRWWKSRIEKEEVQYGVRNGDHEPPKPARKGVTFLNTLGQAQVIGSVTEGPRPATSLSSPSQAASGQAVQAEKQDDTRSVASQVSRASAAVSAAPPSVVAGLKGTSAASVPVSQAKQSQAGSTSQSAVLMKRLEGLEEALAGERMKRLQAEEEMRQLMTLQMQNRQQARKIIK